MNIKPLADRVLVLPAPAEEKIGGMHRQKRKSVVLSFLTQPRRSHFTEQSRP